MGLFFLSLTTFKATSARGCSSVIELECRSTGYAIGPAPLAQFILKIRLIFPGCPRPSVALQR